jgi:hypothetical protein
LRKTSPLGVFFALLGNFLAGLLIDHLHAEPHLAAVVKAQQRGLPWTAADTMGTYGNVWKATER